MSYRIAPFPITLSNVQSLLYCKHLQKFVWMQPRFKGWGISVPKAPRFDAKGVESDMPKALREVGNRMGYPIPADQVVWVSLRCTLLVFVNHFHHSICYKVHNAAFFATHNYQMLGRPIAYWSPYSKVGRTSPLRSL